MTTNEVVKSLAGKLNITQSRARQLLRELLADWTDRIVNGETVHMAGLGRFDIQSTRLRRNYIPGKGTYCVVPPRRRVVFKAAGPLKQVIRAEVRK